MFTCGCVILQDIYLQGKVPKFYRILRRNRPAKLEVILRDQEEPRHEPGAHLRAPGEPHPHACLSTCPTRVIFQFNATTAEEELRLGCGDRDLAQWREREPGIAGVSFSQMVRTFSQVQGVQQIWAHIFLFDF